MFRKYPYVIGEWSLSLGCASWVTCGDLEENAVYKMFGSAQLESFKEASHGSFFWNWTEREDKDWNYQTAHAHGLFSSRAPELPVWNGLGEDPLEETLNPSPA